MSLSKEERAAIMETLKNTARVHGAMTFPAECYEFTELCQQKTVEMGPVDGFNFNVYIFTAKNRESNCPVHINIHGGGFIRPHQKNDSMFSAYLADGIRGIVVDVDYTTSDKAAWPVAFDQCYEVGKYVAAHCVKWNCDPKRISMGGYSAGGVLTAGVALKAAETHDFNLCLQVLGYPPLDSQVHPLYKKNGYIRMMPVEREMAFTRLYFDGDVSNCTNPYASPVYASDELLAKLPRTLICAAAGCNFRYENEYYAERLTAAGVEVTLRRFSGTNHGFIPHFMPGWRDASELIIRTINSASL